MFFVFSHFDYKIWCITYCIRTNKIFSFFEQCVDQTAVGEYICRMAERFIYKKQYTLLYQKYMIQSKRASLHLLAVGAVLENQIWKKCCLTSMPRRPYN